MLHRVLTANEMRLMTQKQHSKLVKREKKDIYNRIHDCIKKEEYYCYYSTFSAPAGTLYPEVKEWLINLGYKIEGTEEDYKWKISW